MGQILDAEGRGSGMNGYTVRTAADADIVDRIGLRVERLGLSDAVVLSEKLAVYLRMLQDWNTRVNLTRVNETDDVIDRHFIESLSVLVKIGFPEKGRLIDVGTGAGFPGLVLAMALPYWQVTLLDAREKRLKFINAVCDATETVNVKTVHARAEDAGRENGLRDSFDIAVARAVAKLDALCGLLLPFVKPGGLALCWKGPAWTEEQAAAIIAAERLGGGIGEAIDCSAGIMRDRTNLIIPIRKLDQK